MVAKQVVMRIPEDEVPQRMVFVLRVRAKITSALLRLSSNYPSEYSYQVSFGKDVKRMLIVHRTKMGTGITTTDVLRCH